ncbi:MAG TPA: alkaline phosphatase family protein [Vicinamibacterales bacterium]|nr:alkaline phosphatase family protein [Vicinamibacterales bacterium]
MQKRTQLSACALAVATALAWGGYTARANRPEDRREDRDDRDQRVKKVFVVAMENHNWTQPTTTTSPQQLFKNPAAPFINSLVDGSSGISDQVAYATNYLSVLSGGAGVHPSEPNYVWAEAGQAFKSIGTDDDPYHADCTADTVVTSDQHLTAFLTKTGKTWKSYQEDVNVDLTTNVPLPATSWTFPLFSHSGKFTTGLNAYNYSSQYNYASKHNPQIFFRDTNGGCPATTSTLYPPLQQLAFDLQDDTVADYTWITPNQYNDQHSALSAGYGVYVPASDQSSIAQGDNFLARIVPLIMASRAYQEGAAILLWWDESEGGDSPDVAMPFIVISKNAHANLGGLPYASNVEYSHSSFLRTMQEIFGVAPWSGHPWLGAAANANDLSALFKSGAIQ